MQPTATDGALSVAELAERGAQHAVRGEFARAIECFDSARSLAQATGDEAAHSDLLGAMGEAYAEQGDLDKAVNYFKEALGLDQAQHDHLGLVVDYRRLGVVYHEKGDHDRAADAYRDAERLLDALPAEDRADEERARLLAAWGEHYADRGHYRKALEVFDRAQAISEARSDNAAIASCLRRIGFVLHQLGSFDAARERLGRAHELLLRGREEERDVPELIEVKLLMGAVLEDEGQTSSSLDCYREALRLAEGLKLGPARAECLRRMGSAYKARGEFAQAVDRYDEAIDICRSLDHQVALSQLFGDLGDVYEEQGLFDLAIKQFKNALDLDQAHQDKLGMALAHRRLGGAYQEKGDYQRAEDSYREAERLLDDSDDHGEKAVLHTHIGSLYEERGHYRNALERYEKALEINENQSNMLGVAVCLRHTGSAKQQRGDLEGASRDLRRAHEVLTQQGGEDKPELIEVTTLLGSVIEDQGHTNEALGHYRDALRLADSLNLAPARAECLRRMGSAYAVCGDFSQAVDRYRQAIDIAREIGDSVALSQLHGDLGDVYAEQGNLDDAVDQFKDALRLDQAHQDELGMAVAYRRLGAAYQRKGDCRRAEDSYRDAKRLLDGLDDDGEKAVLLNNWGSLYEDQGQYRKALDYYGQALAFNENQKNAVGIAICLRLQGSALLQLGDAQAAKDRLMRALDLLREDKPELIAAKDVLARIHLAEGAVDKARSVANEALRLGEDLQHGPARALCLRTLGSVAAAGGNFSDAIDRFDRALDICRSLRDEVMQAELLDDLGDAFLHNREVDKAVEAYNGGLKRARRLDRHALTADILLGLARCQRERGRHDAVRELLTEASDAIDSFDASRLMQAHLTLELAQLAELDGREDVAIESYERALEDFKSTNDVERALECNRLLLRAYSRASDLTRAGVHLSELLEREDQGALWVALVLRRLHPKIAAAAGPAVESGHFGGAVSEAFRAFEVSLRDVAGASPGDEMSKAVRSWFRANSDRGVAPFVDEEEMARFGNFVTSAIDAGRNRHAHQAITMDAREAFAWLGIVHLLMSYLSPPEAS
jgi:tetratricopeptide (TPR) repeat protein